MTTSLNALIAREHVADLRRAAQHYSASNVGRRHKSVELRLAQADDARALKTLAELDEEPELSGEALLALIDDEVVAAISLNDGQVVADPFVATTNAVSLLKLRSHQLASLARRRPVGI